MYLNPDVINSVRNPSRFHTDTTSTLYRYQSRDVSTQLGLPTCSSDMAELDITQTNQQINEELTFVNDQKNDHYRLKH